MDFEENSGPPLLVSSTAMSKVKKSERIELIKPPDSDVPGDHMTVQSSQIINQQQNNNVPCKKR